MIVSLCKGGSYTEAAALIDIKAVVTKALKGSAAELRGSNVYYKDEIVNSLLAKRILTLTKEGFDASPLLLFLENLMSNPSKRAVDELYGFLEVSKLPITDDGHFLAYKSVRDNYKDHYSGTMDNSVGAIVSMERNAVDEDKDRTCSSGLHFAAHEYAEGFGGGKMVVLKINPRDVVAIPSDYSNQKGRCSTYEVLEEVERSDTKLVDKGFVDTGVVGAKATKAANTVLPVGTRVILSALGVDAHGQGETQGGGGEGVIFRLDDGASAFIYNVEWDNEWHNEYKAGELEEVAVVSKKISSSSVTIGESYMFSGYVFNSDLPQPFLGKVVEREGNVVSLDTEVGTQYYSTSSTSPKTEVTLMDTPVVPTYIPQESNYNDISLWPINFETFTLSFDGEAKEFPVDRDVGYSLTRIPDGKEYKGYFFFTNYDQKNNNLVFKRTETKKRRERYVTISDVSEWCIVA
jgi:hypothetical protein